MKLYYFMILAIGIMYTLSLFGVDTASSNILDRITNRNNISNTQLDFTPGTVINSSTISSPSYIFSNFLGSNWWYIFGFILGAFVITGVASGFKIFGSSGVDATGISTALFAVIAGGLWLLFAWDFFSILTFMYEITGGTGWEYHLTWILTVPILFGFGISLFQFIKGTE